MPHAVVDKVPHNRTRYLVDGKVECFGCLEWKLLEEYHKDKNRVYGIARTCKACANAFARTYHKTRFKGEAGKREYRDSQRNYAYKRKYGLSLQEVEQKLLDQDSRCAICSCELELGRGKKEAHVDHNHTTGAVRDILCTRCNSGIGYFRESTQFMESAIAYLEKHNTEVTDGPCRG